MLIHEPENIKSESICRCNSHVKFNF